MDTDEAIGRRLERLRTDLGLSQGELSEKLRAAGVNWSQGTLSRVETGFRPMRFTEALAVAAVLDVEPADLTPTGGGLAPIYHRSVKAVHRHGYRLLQARDQLRKEIGIAQLLRLGLELSRGSRDAYVLRVPPGWALEELRTRIGAESEWDVLAMLGAPSNTIDGARAQVRKDVESEGIPDYAPQWLHDELAQFGSPEPGSDEHHEMLATKRARLECAMAGEVFRRTFPAVGYEVDTDRPLTDGLPYPLVEGIDMEDLEAPQLTELLESELHRGR
ncbi:helix-turn-helix domain-containing protein [Rhodococcus hoagii]|nr:helix-turn-helix domain-containing protein [Prescottella equi]